MTHPPGLKLRVTRTSIPTTILRDYTNVNLYLDFMFVNGLPFLITLSGKLNYVTASYCDTREVSDYIDKLIALRRLYHSRGFTITDWYMDGEFDNKYVHRVSHPAHTHFSGPSGHVPPIGRKIRHVKEHSRCTTHSVPYAYFTKLMRLNLLLL